MRKLLVRAARIAAVTAAVAAPTFVASPPAQAFCCPVFTATQSECLRLQSEYDRYYMITRYCGRTADGTRWMFAYHR